MRLIRTFFFLICLVYLVFFCVVNMQTVPLNIPFFTKIESIPLFLVIILNIIIGVIIGGFVAALNNMKKYVKSSDKRKQVLNMKKRINELEENTII